MNAHKLRNKFFMVCTGKETENMFMMPIDTGNKAIKTENFEFNSGITMLADVPGENEEALMYQGRYYRLSHERNVYLPDKTMDDRYYLLTLFAIAKELEEMSHSKSFIPGELISMDLVVGLPPLYYRGQYKKFREYFYRDGKIVHFVYMGKSYRVTFSNVFVHMQTYAAFKQWCIEQNQEQKKIPEYEKCTVCFVHLYNRDLPLGRIRDHDNFEEKHVLDVISNFFLVSDSGLHVDTYHITRMADKDGTEVYIMDTDKFPRWLQSI